MSLVGGRNRTDEQPSRFGGAWNNQQSAWNKTLWRQDACWESMWCARLSVEWTVQVARRAVDRSRDAVWQGNGSAQLAASESKVAALRLVSGRVHDDAGELGFWLRYRGAVRHASKTNAIDASRSCGLIELDRREPSVASGSGQPLDSLFRFERHWARRMVPSASTSRSPLCVRTSGVSASTRIKSHGAPEGLARRSPASGRRFHGARPTACLVQCHVRNAAGGDESIADSPEALDVDVVDRFLDAVVADEEELAAPFATVAADEPTATAPLPAGWTLPRKKGSPTENACFWPEADFRHRQLAGFGVNGFLCPTPLLNKRGCCALEFENALTFAVMRQVQKAKINQYIEVILNEARLGESGGATLPV
jgi:hypothetical protein